MNEGARSGEYIETVNGAIGLVVEDSDGLAVVCPNDHFGPMFPLEDCEEYIIVGEDVLVEAKSCEYCGGVYRRDYEGECLECGGDVTYRGE